jgi:hypothetical protein
MFVLGVPGRAGRIAVPRFDAYVLMAAGIALLIDVVLVGTYASPAPELLSIGPLVGGETCEEEGFAPASEPSARGHARLCLDEDGVRAWVGLAGLPSGNDYTAWIAEIDRRAELPRVPCGRSEGPPIDPHRVPARLGAATTDDTGRFQVTGDLQGVRVGGDVDLWILVVDHGGASQGDGTDGADAALSWQPGWWGTQSVIDRGASATGRLAGCAHFRPLVGLGVLE